MSNLTDALIAAKLIGAQGGGSGGGSGLPSVTSDDNGDVLTVVDGAWAKAAPSGGGMFVIEVEETSSGGFPPQVTHTVLTPYADIYNACISLQPALLKFLPFSANRSVYVLLSPAVSDNELYYEGGRCLAQEGNVRAWSYYITLDLSGQTVSFSLEDATISPSA